MIFGLIFTLIEDDDVEEEGPYISHSGEIYINIAVKKMKKKLYSLGR